MPKFLVCRLRLLQCAAIKLFSVALIGVWFGCSVQAQPLSSKTWSAEELASSCIPAGEGGLQVRASDCTVRESGKLTDLTGKEIWYALYSNFPELEGETVRRSSPEDFSNVLVLFEAESGGDQLTIVQVSNPEGSFYRQFAVPQVFNSSIGSILYLAGFGLGDGRGQFEYDQYLLWQRDGWVTLNAFAWIPQLTARLPSGHRLNGIDKSRFDLMNMRYRGNVRRDQDCHNCATGGSVEVLFELKRLDFVLKDFTYSPTDTP